MVRHPYTLLHIARELGELSGARVVECYVHREDSFVMCCEHDGKVTDVEVYLTEPIVALSAREHRGRPRHHTRDVFPVLRSSRVLRVIQPKPDRVVIIETSTVNLVIRLFSGGRANVLCVNEQNLVIDCIRDRDKLVLHEISQAAEHGVRLLDMPPDVTVGYAVARCDYLLGPVYADEVCERAGVSAQHLWRELDDETKRKVQRVAEDVMEECRLDPPNVRLFERANGELIVSLIELQRLRRIGESSPRVLPLVEDALRGRFRERRFLQSRERLIRKVTRELRRAERAHEEVSAYMDRVTNAGFLRYKGDLLLSTPDVYKIGDERVELIGWEGERVLVELDPRLRYAENAQVYYQRARRVEAAATQAATRRPRLEQRIAEMQSLLQAINQASSYYELQVIMKNEQLDDTPTSTGKREQSPYRKFDLAEGWTLYVGRSAQNNDELTMRFAKQKDIWLHARGVSGSHAVLRSASSSKPPKNVLETAASIVAYYSKARNAKYTPVVYTMRSNVRKPKGSAVGAVVLDKEETIMVSPGLPPGSAESDV